MFVSKKPVAVLSKLNKAVVRIIPALAIAALVGTCSPRANALPSYSRQTGMPCSACHYTPPELTPFGRQFKAEGYTFATKPEIHDTEKGGRTANLSLLETLPLSAMFFTSYTSTKSPQPTTQNGNFQFPQQAALFIAGRWGEHVGTFTQMTYTASSNHFNWDNTDIRITNFLRGATLLGKSVTYGLTFNNNPTVEDLWNSTPAWGFPYSMSGVAPTPAAGAVVNNRLGQDVAGLGGYGMWNNHIYFAGTMYRSEHLGGSQPNSGTGFNYNVQGVAPYWRAAYTTSAGNNNVEVGTFGMHMKSTPNAVVGPHNSYTDWAVDFQLDHAIPQWKNDVVTLRGSYIRENSSLVASAESGGASRTGHVLNTAQALAEYHLGNRLAATGAFFTTTGTADHLLYAAAPVTGSASGSPASTGAIGQISWWAQQNIQLTAQYTAYSRFNGRDTNYDGSHRDASSNNTTYVQMMFVF